MKRLDEGKTSLVDFMRSIRFAGRKAAKRPSECETHFAHFDPQARPDQHALSAEEQKLVRSAN